MSYGVPESRGLLSHLSAWGDTERELRGMAMETKEAFLEKLQHRIQSLETEGGIVSEPEVRYFYARKADHHASRILENPS